MHKRNPLRPVLTGRSERTLWEKLQTLVARKLYCEGLKTARWLRLDLKEFEKDVHSCAGQALTWIQNHPERHDPERGSLACLAILKGREYLRTLFLQERRWRQMTRTLLEQVPTHNGGAYEEKRFRGLLERDRLKILRELPRNQLEVLVLFHVCDLTIQEIGDFYGQNANSIRCLLVRARKNSRALLEGHALARRGRPPQSKGAVHGHPH